jgi:hypothetical protein
MVAGRVNPLPPEARASAGVMVASSWVMGFLAWYRHTFFSIA